MGCGEVDLIPRLEDKWATACIGILQLPILCNCEEGLGVV
jgi:hypothetical protein